MSTLKDWRGNTYRAGEPLGIRCEWPGDCDKEAVRHRCNAESTGARTHWHGGIHRLDGGGGFHFCLEHGREVLLLNDAVAAARGMAKASEGQGAPKKFKRFIVHHMEQAYALGETAEEVRATYANKGYDVRHVGLDPAQEQEPEGGPR